MDGSAMQLSRESPPTGDAGPLRISVVTETWPPEVNGVAMTIHRMVQWLGRRHDVTLIRIRQGVADRGATIPGVNTLSVRGIPLPRYHELRMGLPCTGLLKKRWRQERPDVVHVITEGPLGWSAVRAANALGIPVVSDFHTNFHQYAAHYGVGLLRPIALRYLRRLHNRSRLTLVPTRALATELQQQGFRQLEILARGIDIECFHPCHRSSHLRDTWGAGPDDPVLLMVSRVAPEKNLPLALQAFARTRERVPGVRMVVVGDGPARNAIAASHPDVYFAGMQTGAALAEHYASADIFVFPSLSETFGNVTLEAMASGLAVVAFDYAAAREHIVDGGNGRTVPCSDSSGFIRVTTELATDRAQVARLAAAARETALEIDWSRICRRYEEILRHCPEHVRC
jgi:glycosyltransferase involved in cell wall biosynthesis